MDINKLNPTVQMMVKTLQKPNYDYIIYICLFLFDLMMLTYFHFWY